MNTNSFIVLNPDYNFKNDIDRIVMYSKKKGIYNSSTDWISCIHPFQAMLLSAFTTPKTLKEHITEISEQIHVPYQKLLDIILPYINNAEAFYTLVGNEQTRFPKNVLITVDDIDAEYHYGFTPDDLHCEHINLTPDRMHRAPNSFLFMLTNKCVTNCKYCYADKETQCDELTTEEILSIIKEAHDLKLSNIDIIGGEVFCKKDWDIILKALVDMDLTPTYISTKVPVTEQIAERLYETGYNNVVQISLDSLNENCLKEIIECKEGYVQKTQEGISILERYGFPIQIDTVLTKYNSDKKTLSDLYQYVNGIKNLTLWEIRVPEMSIYRPESFTKIRADKNQLSEICNFVKKELKPQANIKIVVSDNILYKTYRSDKTCDSCFDGSVCSILKNRFFVLPDGKVSLCEQLYWQPQFIIGDLKKQSLQEVWNSPKALELIKREYEAPKETSPCKHCKAFDFCKESHKKCFVRVLKAYGKENWDYPDPFCQYAPKFENDFEY